VRVARIFNTFGPRMHFNDGTFCVHGVGWLEHAQH